MPPAAANLGEKVCPNHPNKPATSRCVACFKPLCQMCVVLRQGLDFCSDQCAKKHFASSSSIAAFQVKEKEARRRAAIRKLITTVIVLALAGLAYWAYRNNVGGLADQINKLIKQN